MNINHIVSSTARGQSQSHVCELCLHTIRLYRTYQESLRGVIQRWLIKLEEEDSVRGLAFFDITNITGLEGFLRETVQQLSQASKGQKDAEGISKGWLRAGTKVSLALPADELRAQVRRQCLMLQRWSCCTS